MTEGNGAKPGWYAADPAKPDELRWWDGSAWTDRYQQAAKAPAGDTAVIASATGTAGATATSADQQPWWLTWPAIAVGFLLYIVPGVVLLWLRKGPPIWVKGAVTGVAFVLILVMGLSAGSADTAPAASSTPSASPTPTASATPTPTASAMPTPSPTPTPSASETTVEEEPAPAETTETASSLADTVWAEIVAEFGGEIPVESPLYFVTDVEDVSSGTIRVFVQLPLTDDDRETIARHVFNLGAWSNTDLKTVVVQDTTGIDSNHYRWDYPALDQ